jgi:phage terminase small subunit
MKTKLGITTNHLRRATRRWVRETAQEYVLEPHHERLLVLAGEAWDRCQQARETLGVEGLTVADRFGQTRAHPCIAVERDSRIAFARLLRDLGLDDDGPNPVGRPPGT